MNAHELFKFCMDNVVSLTITPIDFPGTYMITATRGANTATSKIVLEESSLDSDEILKYALSEILWALHDGGYTT